MPTNIYKTKDGKRQPGASTIATFPYPDKFRIGMLWACKMFDQGKDPRQETGVEVGTLAHALVHADLLGLTVESVDKSIYTLEQISRAESAYLNFLEWKANYKVKPLAQYCEQPLVSEIHRFGGTPDIIALFGDRGLHGVIDIKSTNELWPSHRLQIAGYGILWEENHPDRPLDGGYHLLKIGKDDASFQHNYYADLKVHKEVFLMLRSLYALKDVV